MSERPQRLTPAGLAHEVAVAYAAVADAGMVAYLERLIADALERYGTQCWAGLAEATERRLAPLRLRIDALEAELLDLEDLHLDTYDDCAAAYAALKRGYGTLKNAETMPEPVAEAMVALIRGAGVLANARTN